MFKYAYWAIYIFAILRPSQGFVSKPYRDFQMYPDIGMEERSSFGGFATGSTPADDLIITGIIDGPRMGGRPKAIELHVGNDIADLSIYGLGSANNGGGSDGEEFTFPAVAVSAGTFIYVASESDQFTAYMGFAPDYIDSVANVNGDDAMELFKNNVAIDVYGDINVDGSGQAWEYLDGWGYRNCGARATTTFSSSDWSFSGRNALDADGTDGTLAASATPWPIKTYTP